MIFKASIVPTHHPRKTSNNGLASLRIKFNDKIAKYSKMKLPLPSKDKSHDVKYPE